METNETCNEIDMTATDPSIIDAPGLPIPEEDTPLVIDFIAEANEHIESAETGLLTLEKQPTDEEVIHTIFRSFHTIKGMAGFLNLHDIGSLAHAAENLLDLARKGQLQLRDASLDAIFESMDTMKKMLGQLKEAVQSHVPFKAPDSLPKLLAHLKACMEEAGMPGSPGSPPVDCTEAPPITDPEKEPRKPAATIDEGLQTDPNPEADTQLEKVLDTTPKANIKINYGKSKTLTSDEKIKVSTDRLDTLIDTVGELVIANLMVAEEVKDRLSGDHVLGTKVSHMSKIVRELQELSMAMRMVPIQGVFHRMTRLVRDLAKKSGKDIQFITQGEDTELDRTVVDKIADPLVHMIRNSVDHGIEIPEERKTADKTPTGTVELRAFHKAGHVVIEIIDDGRGLNKQKIVQKAVDNGILEPGQEISDEEAYRLIFHAGLSTARQITDISGRGVGMDVVRKNIETLQGKIDIASQAGQGTVFSIRLPLTLAIIDGQIIRVGMERYIVPINSIINSFRPQPEQITSVQAQGELVNVRGELMSLVRLHDLFHVDPRTRNPADSLLVVVEAEEKRCCLLVDELLGQQQVVIKNLGQGIGTVPGVAGGAIMGDGRVSLILDIPGLIDLARVHTPETEVCSV